MLLTSREHATELTLLSSNNMHMTQVYSTWVQLVLDPFMRQLSFCFSLLAETAVKFRNFTDEPENYIQ